MMDSRYFRFLNKILNFEFKNTVEIDIKDSEGTFLTYSLYIR